MLLQPQGAAGFAMVSSNLKGCPMTRLTTLLLGVALGAFVSTANADNEDALYGAPVPSDAVFIRPIGEIDAPVSILGRNFTSAELPEAVYAAISASMLEGAEAGAHYTVLAGADQPQLIEEPGRDDPAKMYLFLLNADASDARLRVAAGGPTVIEDTTEGTIASRAVNPLAVALAVETAGASEKFDVILRQGESVTFLVSDGDLTVFEDQFGLVIGGN